jgi:two-component system, cell cycle response regulator
MEARIKTQIRRKKYQDALRSNYQASVSMAITDKLTGLYNRNFLDAHIQNIVNQSLLNQKAFSIMMLDMDHFKSVNDTYGHDVGDEILRELSKRMINAIRSSDLAARIGGEEFMVLMPETGYADAYGMADRMRLQIAREPFRISHAEGQITKTISIGIAELNLANDNAAALIKRADNALYEAKNGGRNRVCPVLQTVAAPLRPSATGLKPLSSYAGDEIQPRNYSDF